MTLPTLQRDHGREPATADEARAEAAKCGRRIDICLKAGEYAEARRQLDEAKRFALLAFELERAAA